GPLDRLPVEVDLAATRIIREALTNVARHSGAGEARLAVTAGDGLIMIRVEDDVRGVTYTEGSGIGLRRMSARNGAPGGRREAGRHRGRRTYHDPRGRRRARRHVHRRQRLRAARHARTRRRAGRQPGGGPPAGGRLPRPRHSAAERSYMIRVLLADDQTLVRA